MYLGECLSVLYYALGRQGPLVERVMAAVRGSPSRGVPVWCPAPGAKQLRPVSCGGAWVLTTQAGALEVANDQMWLSQRCQMPVLL